MDAGGVVLHELPGDGKVLRLVRILGMTFHAHFRFILSAHRIASGSDASDPMLPMTIGAHRSIRAPLLQRLAMRGLRKIGSGLCVAATAHRGNILPASGRGRILRRHFYMVAVAIDTGCPLATGARNPAMYARHIFLGELHQPIAVFG